MIAYLDASVILRLILGERGRLAEWKRVETAVAIALTEVECLRILWQMRDRLGARDRDLFLAMPMVGPNHPRPSSSAVVLLQAERAANAALDSPQARFAVDASPRRR